MNSFHRYAKVLYSVFNCMYWGTKMMSASLNMNKINQLNLCNLQELSQEILQKNMRFTKFLRHC